MDPIEKAIFEAAGIPVFSESEFLRLSPEQEAIVETKVRLSYALRRARKAAGLTQAALAEKMKAPQQTVARLETAHKSATIDLLMRALLVAGASLEEISQEIARGGERVRGERGEVAGEIRAETFPIKPLQKPLPPAASRPQQMRIAGQGIGQLQPLSFRFTAAVVGFDDSLCKVEMEEAQKDR